MIKSSRSSLLSKVPAGKEKVEEVVSWTFDESAQEMRYLLRSDSKDDFWILEKYLAPSQDRVRRFAHESYFSKTLTQSRKTKSIGTAASVAETVKALSSVRRNVSDISRQEDIDITSSFPAAHGHLEVDVEDPNLGSDSETSLNVGAAHYIEDEDNAQYARRGVSHVEVSHCGTRPAFWPKKREYLDDFMISSGIIIDLETLCNYTGTVAIFSQFCEGVFHAVGLLGNRNLAATFTSAQRLDGTTAPLVGAVWLACCYRSYTGKTHAGKASTACTTFYEASCQLLGNPEGDTEYRTYVHYWEDQLMGLLEWKVKLNELGLDFVLLDSTQEVELESRPYLSALESSSPLYQLSNELIERDAQRGTSPMHRLIQDAESERYVRSEVIQSLATLQEGMIRSCIKSTIGVDKRAHGHETQQQIKLHEDLCQQPVVYLNQIVDKAGISPTAKQLQQAVKVALQYIDTDNDAYNDIAFQIDCQIARPRKWSQEHTNQGLRRYCDFSKSIIKRNWELNEARRTTMQKFLEALSDRLQLQVQSNHGHRPFSRPLSNVGFTKNATHRLKEHKRHQNSNWMMNVFEAILQWLYPDTFVLDQTILLICWKPSHAWIGEIIFHAMIDCYSTDGKGFAYHPPGYSNIGAYKSATAQELDKWAETVETTFGLTQRLRDEAEGIKEAVRKAERRYKKLANKEQDRKVRHDKEKREQEQYYALGIIRA
ncbi:hypothetical protein H2198_001612 [Neophaeococcomyces mojaviensis]|uniref:Uncharacterized protein n=1 Tax=Neophaeococcomyces mojaviensis TaxID=3383035 RepID=A0ACC3AGN3_9EURO|nr:hypothetical protein H2198_001612 [Knufia sp. JES_112]